TGWTLHPALAGGADPVLRQARATASSFSVPGRSTAVFVLPRAGAAAATPAPAATAVSAAGVVAAGVVAAPTPVGTALLPPTGGSLQEAPPSQSDPASLPGMLITGALAVASLVILRRKSRAGEAKAKK
ncbi:MAG: DUF3372 domain-containing protein, partial [Thermoflexales bacterium]|nr:DUF3372 domain-containing protein [Thermoflexales bacterium]